MESKKESPDAPVHAVVHTPGPWSVTEKYFDEHGEALRQIEAESHMLAEVYVCDGDEGDANARLMAASPELLAACRDMIQAMNDYECSVDDPPTPKHREMMLRAMSAVDKATYQVV
jgi:hypothetical protein